ncbi:ABC transporter permease [Clostridium chromiireducens]|uniref:ABC transporter permease n=1 Tax=Clostridium chromiireducens TaxID=225345 RepID=A0A1V4IGM6_9CLOT|nr:ABC transporter permease [Clostridium chromiireducens]MVX63232.1 ABC transporter permease subunit [Clostridium chromiireducens]OPJ59151.1 putative aliphatic sulfonates transport permease protein SsuC [Clostridium chromiireducens]RII33871.1 ABC transporter permease [Clostridium chromiireducens]
MISRKEKYTVNLVWAISIFIVWELAAFFLEQVIHDPMAAAKLPYPHSVLISIAVNFTDLISAAGLTFSRAVFGFALGAAIGFILAIIMSLSKIAEKISLPYLIVSQMIPVLGLAPIIFTLVRDMNLSRIVIAAYITFFPVSVNMLSGLNSVESDKKELLYSYAARKKSIYYKLMIPYSMPYLFAGLKIAAPMSITASILVDMLGSSGGIGVKLLYSLYSGTKDVFWASVVTSALMGILSYFIVILFEKICMPWRKQTT